MKTAKKALIGVLIALSVAYYFMFDTSWISAVGPDGEPIGVGAAIVHRLTVGSSNRIRVTPVATKPTATAITSASTALASFATRLAAFTPWPTQPAITLFGAKPTATRLPTGTQIPTPTPTARAVRGVIPTRTPTPSVDEATTDPYTSFTTYSNPEVGVAFRYPDFLSVNIDTQKERTASGEMLEVVMMNAESRDQSLLISLLIGDAESIEGSEWYPPREEYLRFQAYFGLLMMWHGDFEWSDQAEEAFWEVTQSADMGTIAGFPAVAYSLELEETPYGRLYLKGATVISPTKQTDIAVIGVDDPHAPIRVPREALDRIWDELATSLVLPE